MKAESSIDPNVLRDEKIAKEALSILQEKM